LFKQLEKKKKREREGDPCTFKKIKEEKKSKKSAIQKLETSAFLMPWIFSCCVLMG
jgi:hypothetical protein